MKISVDKNTAYSNQPKPLVFKDLSRRIRARKASKPAEGLPVEFGLALAAGDRPEIQMLLEEGDAGKGRGHRLRLTVNNFKLGEHVFPPNTKTKLLPAIGNRKKASGKPLQVEPFLPDHLDLRPVPRPLPK